jgi:hypothetical protein
MPRGDERFQLRKGTGTPWGRDAAVAGSGLKAVLIQRIGRQRGVGGRRVAGN